jgi:hypothetical protein
MKALSAHMAHMALMARGVSRDLSSCQPSRRNQKKLSIYLSFCGARGTDGGRAISAISAARSSSAGHRDQYATACLL